MAICQAFGLRCGATDAGFQAEPARLSIQIILADCQAHTLVARLGVSGGFPVSGCRRSRLLLNLAELPPGAGGTHPTGSLFSIPCHDTNRRSRTLLTNPSIINTDNMLDPP